MTVKTAPISEGNVDSVLLSIVDNKREHIASKEDDNLILIVGDTGSGKSNLALHIMDHYLNDAMSVDLIGLNRDSIAKAIGKATTMPLPRACLLDEANINKRDSLSKFNKDMMDLFFAIRGKQVFWLWCNPSLDMMDKFFIKERINSVIYVMKKGTSSRAYYYFTKKSVLEMLKKYGNLEMSLLKKVRKKYALYRGWFKEYVGDMKKPYIDKKEERMTEKVENFMTNWVTEPKDKEKLKPSEILKRADISVGTFKKYQREFIESGDLIEGENMFTDAIGRKKYAPSVVILCMEKLKANYLRNSKNFKNLVGHPDHEQKT